MIVSSEGICPSAGHYGPLRVMQWTHSVTELPDFQAPWQAIDNAFDLAYELGGRGSSIWALETPPFPARRSRKAPGSVNFSSRIEVLLGDSETLTMSSIWAQHDHLQD